MHDDYARTLCRYGRGVCAAYLLALCLAACAGATMSHSAGLYAGPIDPPDRSASLYSVLGEEEIRAQPFQTAYDAVSKLRPRYLTARYANHDLHSVAPVVVIEGGLPEPIDVLRKIAADAVAEIGFIEGPDAVTKFGARYSGGVVTVRLANGGRSRRPLTLLELISSVTGNTTFTHNALVATHHVFETTQNAFVTRGVVVVVPVPHDKLAER